VLLIVITVPEVKLSPQGARSALERDH